MKRKKAAATVRKNRTVPPAWITPKPPRGMIYQWNVVRVFGKPVSQETLTGYGEAGWRLVPKSRHGKQFSVEHSGCRLMERSRKLSVAAAKEEWQTAHDQQIDALKGGMVERMPEGISIVIAAKDAPYILTGIGWMPTSEVRRLEAERDRINGILGEP